MVLLKLEDFEILGPHATNPSGPMFLAKSSLGTLSEKKNGIMWEKFPNRGGVSPKPTSWFLMYIF